MELNKKEYRLLKDLPFAKAGRTFVYDSEYRCYCLKYCPKKCIRVEDIREVDEWFELIEDSNRWFPEKNEEYFHLSGNGGVSYNTWLNTEIDKGYSRIDNVFKTKKEVERAKEWLEAWTTLKYSSNYKPEWDCSCRIYSINYNHRDEVLDTIETISCQEISPIFFKTESAARRSIEEYEREWKIIFGVEGK